MFYMVMMPNERTLRRMFISIVWKELELGNSLFLPKKDELLHG